MSRIKLKKLTLQYAFLKLEKEEVEEACSGQEKEIQEYMRKYYPEYYEVSPEAEEKPKQEDAENKAEKTDNKQQDIPEDSEPEDIEEFEERE